MSFKEKIKSHKHLLINILLALVFFAAGYFTRFFTASSTQPGAPGNGNFTRNSGDMPTMNQDGTSGSSSATTRNTSGTIVSNSGSYITIKLSNGSTKNVYISDSTTIYSRSKTTTDELTADKTVTIQGETNSDNSINGTTITIE